VSAELLPLLRGLTETDWHRPATARGWQVRDVVAHLIDGALRRLSFHRDRQPPPGPDRPIASERDFVRFINALNAEWVSAARRLSLRVLVDLYALASVHLADWFEQLPLDAPALFAVSWAGEDRSEGWFDIGREFTELWHHQQQVRDAVGAPPLADPRYLRAVLDIAMRALPHACRDLAADAGQILVVDISGPAGSQWTVIREADRWTLHSGASPAHMALVQLSDDVAWRLLFNGLPRDEAAALVHVHGDAALADAFLRARSVIV
jgi:uncharacterized protein (TIGR03083 family)